MEEWLRQDVVDRFEVRIIALDASVARTWGRIMVRTEKAGRPLSPTDGFIGATADFHDLTLVTRNVGDFALALRAVFNPWEYRRHGRVVYAPCAR